jgi:8-oxo-dGTP pyrophosphatase MutT (NUDIX family)
LYDFTNFLHFEFMSEGLIRQMKERLPLLEDTASHTFGNTPRLAAVMITLYYIDNELYIPFIVRPAYDGVHSGQVAFPGGKMEEIDQSPIHNAIREAYEEVGMEVPHESVIGTMPKIYVVPSNMLVTPVLAYLAERPSYVLDSNEVAKLLEIKVSDLLNPHNHSKKQVIFPNNVKMNFPSYLVQGEEIWGATARMLSEFFKLIT